MNTIVMFKGASRYGNVNRMADDLSAAFARLGFGVRPVDLNDPGHEGLLLRILDQGGVALIVSFTGFGLDLEADDNLFNRYAYPLLTVYLDPVLLYWNQVEAPIENRIISCIAGADVQFCRAHRGGRAQVRHLPHAARPRAPLPWERRDIPVLFSGSLSGDPEALRNGWRDYGRDVEARLNKMLDAVAAAPMRPLTDVIAEVASDEGLALATPREIHPYFATLDGFLRSRKRRDAVAALLDQPITVVGGGWEALAERPGRARFLGERDATEVCALTRRAKLVLNVCTNHHGSHERVFDAMAAGAVAVSTRTPFFADAVPPGAMVLYGADERNLSSCVAGLLDDDAAAQAIAGAGRKAFLAAHTWDHRAQSIVGWLDSLSD